MTPRVTVLYHYFPPDDVVSARHYGDLCAGLAARGWRVEALPCNRRCHGDQAPLARFEEWEGVNVRRVWRPRFRQASGLGRVLSAAWMLVAWSGIALRRRDKAPHVLVVGTDPILGVLAGYVVKVLRPGIRVAHWAFDLYPESAVADGLLRAGGRADRLLRRLLRRAYRRCDLVADLGGCMRARLEAYGHAGRKVTLVPWALAEPDHVEPPDPAARRELFGDARLGLLYSGNLGRAHAFAEFLDLARRLRGEGVHFSFGIRGHRADELRAALGPDDTNATLAAFAPEAELVKRLTAADVHLVSLKPSWTGLVVPSKFFGALAAGRPVLFAGSRDSAIARWIDEYRVGWVLDGKSSDDVASDLRVLKDCPAKLAELQRHCQRVYREQFAREHILDRWHEELQALLETAPAASASAGVIQPVASAPG